MVIALHQQCGVERCAQRTAMGGADTFNFHVSCIIDRQQIVVVTALAMPMLSARKYYSYPGARYCSPTSL